jgi:hypothetical protein
MYVLDTDVFIDAKNRHYGFDFVPGFWDWLVDKHAAGVLCSITDVKKEIDDGNDALKEWAKNHSNLFVPLDATVQPSLQLLSAWANSSNFTGAAIATFLGAADYSLIAFAHAHSHIVVTQERSDPNAKKRIFIPDGCTALGVPCMDPFEMLRTEGAKFVQAT